MTSTIVEKTDTPFMIGRGGCGRVFLQPDEDGGWLALKKFDEQAVNLPLLERMTRRLGEGGWPSGVLPVLRSDFEGTAAFRLSPLLAEVGDNGKSVSPRSLQHDSGALAGTDGHTTIESLARALAAMHVRGVAHGNLKPGNVFLDPDGGVLLTDWTLGNMPGIREFQFTDAILYQPPEQLRDAAGYSGVSGFRWDVFAFGVLAFRILNGRFPRCDETYRRVAPPLGTTGRDDLIVDLEKVARSLESADEWRWPDSSTMPDDDNLRKCIGRCLFLDPSGRPADMVQVVSELYPTAKTEAIIRSAGDGTGVTLDVKSLQASESNESDRWSHLPYAGEEGVKSTHDDRAIPETELWGFVEEMGLDESSAAMEPAPPEISRQPEPAVMRDPVVPVAGNTPPPVESANQEIPARATGDWLTDEAAESEAPPVSGRRSRRQGKAGEVHDRSPVPVALQRQKLSILEILGMLVLAGLLATAGGWALLHSIFILPPKAQVWACPDFPVHGHKLSLDSAQCYWRVPLVSGAEVDRCRHGTVLLPVVEFTVSEGASMVRVQFKNEEGKTTGDPVIRSVKPGEVVRIAGTAGFEDSGTYAAYRIAEKTPWTAEIREMSGEEQPSGEADTVLLSLNIPGCIR